VSFLLFLRSISPFYCDSGSSVGRSGKKVA
jgi:hypothetical protein